MDKKILLVSIMLYPQYPNSGVDHIAGFLRWKGYSVDIAYFHKNNSLEEVKANIAYDYDYFGLYIDIKNVERCIALADYIKEKTSTTIWFGGTYVACCYKNLFEDCVGVDYIILGGGEEPLLYLLTHGPGLEVDMHPHIASRTSLEGKRFNENKMLEYPIADDYFIRYPEVRGFYTYCLQTKNNTCGGCCTFCINWCIKRERMNFHYRTIETILGEMKHIYEAYSITHFFFIDDDLLDPCTREAKDRIAGLCSAIIDSGMKVTMTGYTKANALTECKEDEDLLDLMSRAGFVSLFVGIESGCQTDLNLFRKQASVEDNKAILPLLYKHHIKPEYEMITFHPYTTIESLKENFLFLKEVKSYNYRQYSLTSVSIYQNTMLWNQASRDGLLTEKYSYKNPDMYRYLHSDVAYMAEFVKEHFDRNEEISSLVNADQLVTYYYRFSHYSKSVGSLEEAVNKVREDNFELMQNIFEPLYMRCDYDACERRYASFVKEYKIQAEIIQKLINKMLKFSLLDAK